MEAIVSDENKDNIKANCIFCKMASNEVQSKKVYEDDKILAILDIYPANPGHVLIMPKEHYSIMPLIPDDELGHLFVVAKAISTALLKALNVKGTNIFVANGAIAGQKSPHFLMHIIPRHESDNLNLKIPQRQISNEDLMASREMLIKKINEFLPESLLNKQANKANKASQASQAEQSNAILQQKPQQEAGYDHKDSNALFSKLDSLGKISQTPKGENKTASRKMSDIDKVAGLLSGNKMFNTQRNLQDESQSKITQPKNVDEDLQEKDKALSLDDISRFFEQISKKKI